ncbi:response regulator transcription factor [Sphingomonas sp.]|uniref:response regulator n=1 Tax=Sphingomonas sp. TaxID=28214 RepID=UPI001EB79C2B|nr:response regulator transcription factor [Sphingomonas sp.]MBX3592889.1 response regulator transcription factor [Sphingomonas sp.]
MTRLLIADDHPIMISGLQAALRDTGFDIVTTASTGEEALARLDARIDIIILDLRMPGMNGIEVLRTLRDRADPRPVVLLTAELSDSLLLDALALRVNGIVLKDRAQESLITCLERVRGGEQSIDPDLLRHAREVTERLEREADPLAALSRREREIAGHIAKGQRNREIAEHLGITEGTVKLYLHRIYGKLNVTSRIELALITRGIFEDE